MHGWGVDKSSTPCFKFVVVETFLQNNNSLVVLSRIIVLPLHPDKIRPVGGIKLIKNLYIKSCAYC